MKTILSLIIFLFSFSSLIAQPGISVQGVARDAQKAALVDATLLFTFEILEDGGGTSYYKENITIKTDPYGVFSHIIGTGNILAGSGDFIDIPFRQVQMKLIITVDYNGAPVEVSNGPLQYAPYAISAENGVPTGTIIAFAGAEINIPRGWVLCDGRALAGITGSNNLVALIGANAPNLQGMFLRGTGNAGAGHAGPALRAIQQDGLKSHLHSKGTLDVPSNSGGHLHTTTYPLEKSYDDGDGGSNYRYDKNGGDGTHNRNTNAGGGHDHSITGSTANTGTTETRPVNYGVNYIIKL